MGRTVTMIPGVISTVGLGATLVDVLVVRSGYMGLTSYLVMLAGAAVQAAVNRRVFNRAGFALADVTHDRRSRFSVNPMRVEHSGWGAQLSIVF